MQMQADVTEATISTAISSQTAKAPVIAETPAETPADVQEQPTAPVVEQSAPVVSGGLVSGTTEAVGAAAIEEGVSATTLANKLSDAEAAALGIEGFSKEGQELIKQVLAEGSTVTKMTIREVIEYSKAMSPSSVMRPIEGGQKQVAFYRCLQNAINNGGEDFKLMFATILRIIFELKDTGAFQAHYAFRFFETMNLNKEDRTTFHNLLHVMITLSSTASRATSIRQIDLNKAFDSGISAAGRQRLISFFAI